MTHGCSTAGRACVRGAAGHRPRAGAHLDHARDVHVGQHAEADVHVEGHEVQHVQHAVGDVEQHVGHEAAVRVPAPGVVAAAQAVVEDALHAVVELRQAGVERVDVPRHGGELCRFRVVAQLVFHLGGVDRALHQAVHLGGRARRRAARRRRHRLCRAGAEFGHLNHDEHHRGRH